MPVGTAATSARERVEVAACAAAGVEVVEGAAGNLPDPAAEAAATRIAELVAAAGQGDLVLFLLSGEERKQKNNQPNKKQKQQRNNHQAEARRCSPSPSLP